MDPADIRRRVITRGSIDVDLSIADEFEDVEDIATRMWSEHRRDFEVAGYRLFKLEGPQAAR